MKYKALFIIFGVCLIASLMLALTPTPLICSKGCDLVQTSKYAYTFGIKNSWYGVVIFLALMIMVTYYKAEKKPRLRHAIHTGLIIGSLIAIYFLYLQMYVLRSYCKYCLVVDIGLLIGMGIAMWKWED